jgi:ribosomal protein S12 methylthiotransferase accessory factor
VEHDAKLARICRSLIHPRVGVFRKFVDVPRVQGASGLFHVKVEMVDPVYFRYLAHAGASGDRKAAAGVREASGAGLTRREAQWAAVGEGVERYAANICVDDSRAVGSYQEYAREAVDPDDFILYAAGQYAQPDFPFHPHDPREVRQWTFAIDLLTGERRLVPAQLVWLGLKCLGPGELLRQSLSSGLACGATREQCAHSALREVIERDAFMATWLLRYPPP